MELLRIEREIRAPAARAWALVSDFGGVSRWSPLVTQCTVDHTENVTVRTILYEDGRAVREQLLELDGAAYRLSYLFLSGAVLPVQNFTGEISVAPSSPDRCRVAWTYRGESEGEDSNTEFVANLASRTVRRLADLELAATALHPAG